MYKSSLAWIAGAAMGLSAMTADAHVIITSHQTRYGESFIKAGPCGKAGGTRSENVYTYRPGETITLEWDEFVYHAGYFRISFDTDGDDDFVDPPNAQDFAQSDTILLDGIALGHTPSDGPIFQSTVTLPNVECDNCTLQLIQMMSSSNSVYYNCVDMVLTGDPAIPTDPPAPHDGIVVRGCNVATPEDGGWGFAAAGLALVGAALVWRKTRRA